MEISMHSKYIILVGALGVSMASAAWAADEPAQPATTPAASSQAAPADAAASTQAATKTPAKDTAAAAKNSEAEAQEKHLLARGYKKETRSNGQVVYCRKELKTGSHFETKQCGTAESMALAEQQARDLMQNSQNSSGSRVN
jgi:hypothetical protein